jgi:replication initiator protein RepSA
MRPVQLRRTDTVTGEVTQVLIPCRATLASICPPCAERAKALRAAQCQEGWHLKDEPDLSPAAPDETQEYWLTLRAEAQAYRDRAADRGEPVAEIDDLIAELDTEITRVGVRGTVTTTRASDGGPKGRRSRSTRRRQDAAPLLRRKVPPARWAGCSPPRMASLTGPRCS